MYILSYIIAVIICFITAYWGKNKGYNSIAWFCAGSIIGLIVLAFLPNINDINEDKKVMLINKGNTIAICIAVASFVWGFSQGLNL